MIKVGIKYFMRDLIVTSSISVSETDIRKISGMTKLQWKT